MTNIQTNKALQSFNNCYEIIWALESVIKLTLEACLKREISSLHYNLDNNEKFMLSEERNHYINMLSIANEKIEKLKEKTLIIEKELSLL